MAVFSFICIYFIYNIGGSTIFLVGWFGFLGGLGFELRALHLQSKYSTTQATPHFEAFCFGYFGDGVLGSFV
jgi:hypothetical protein